MGDFAALQDATMNPHHLENNTFCIRAATAQPSLTVVQVGSGADIDISELENKVKAEIMGHTKATPDRVKTSMRASYRTDPSAWARKLQQDLNNMRATLDPNDPKAKDLLWTGSFLSRNYDFLLHTDTEMAALAWKRVSECTKNPYWIADSKGRLKLHPDMDLLLRRQPIFYQAAPIEVQMAVGTTGVANEENMMLEGSFPDAKKMMQTSMTSSADHLHALRSAPPPVGPFAVPEVNMNTAFGDVPGSVNLQMLVRSERTAVETSKTTINHRNSDVNEVSIDDSTNTTNSEDEVTAFAVYGGKQNHEQLGASANARFKRKRAVPKTVDSPRRVKLRQIATVNDGRTKTRHADQGVTNYCWPESRIFWWLLKNHDKSLDDLPVCAVGPFWHPLWSVCTPPTVDITLLKDLRITVEEMLTFFPLHTLWRLFSHRLVRNGWGATHIVRFIYWTRSITDLTALIRSTVLKQIQTSDFYVDAQHYSRTNHRPKNRGFYMNFTFNNMDKTRGLIGTNKDLEADWFLHELANGVTIMPRGRGRGALTMAFLHAQEHGHSVLLSEVPGYVRTWGLDPGLAMEGDDVNPDVEALQRHKDVMKQYCDSIGWKG